MGLAEQDFWRLTLAQFHAILMRYNLSEQRQNYRTAFLSSVIANCAPFIKHDRTFTPDDFMPQSERKKPTAEQLAEKCKVLNAMLGGKVIEK